MSLRFGSLGSGSEGNALIVEVKSIVGTTRIMMDCGFGLAETERRLARLGLLPSDLDGIAVTHEHSDHIGGVARFARKHCIPVWLTHGTPYYVPHDANEPVQYVFSDGDKRLGVLTDTGTLTTHIEETLSGCNALVLECNHDLDMLMNGPYPASLKRRVAGRFGHLDNATSAQLLTRIDCTKLTHLFAAHLSSSNNLPSLARLALAGAMNCELDWIGIAEQELGFDWRDA
jgi:phosphoribosyl 1,2-cyclic phosphodiesterase